MGFFKQLLGSRPARLAPRSRSLGSSRTIRVTILLLLSHLVAQLHLDRKHLLLGVPPQGYLARLNRRLLSLRILLSVLRRRRLSGVQCLHLGRLHLPLSVIHRRLLAVGLSMESILIFFHL